MGHAGAAAGTSLGPRDSWGHCCTPPVGCRENAPPCLCSVGTQEWNEAQVARKGAPLPFRPQRNRQEPAPVGGTPHCHCCLGHPNGGSAGVALSGNIAGP